MTIYDKCIVCDKKISIGDIFMKMEIDMRRLIYDEFEGEENFLRVPDGPVHSTIKFYLCDECSNGLMISAPRDMATAIIRSINIKTLVIEDIPRDEAKEKIKELIKQSDDGIYPDDISEKLHIDFKLVMEIVEELIKEGKIAVGNE